MTDALTGDQYHYFVVIKINRYDRYSCEITTKFTTANEQDSTKERRTCGLL